MCLPYSRGIKGLMLRNGKWWEEGWLGQHDCDVTVDRYHYQGTTSIEGTAWSSSDLEDNNFVCPRQDCLIEWFYQRCFFLRPVLLCLSTLLFHLTIIKRAKQQWSSKDRSENKSANLAAALLWPRWLNVSKQLAFKMGPREQFITTTVWSLGTDK